MSSAIFMGLALVAIGLGEIAGKDFSDRDVIMTDIQIADLEGRN